MGLRPLREEQTVNVDHIGLKTAERGGILSYGSASGLVILEYAKDPSGARPLGIQKNDIENLNLSREFHPRRNREVEQPLGIVGVITDGIVTTDWITIIGSVSSGDSAYVGPSGPITNSSSFGGVKVGYFLSNLENDSHLVTFEGLGFSATTPDPTTKLPVTENDPSNRTLVLSNGWIKLRISQNILIQDQLDKGI